MCRPNLGYSRIHLVMCLIFVFAIVWIGCNRTNERGTPDAEGVAEERIRVAYLPIAECLPLFVAVDKGYLKNVELTSFPGGSQALEALNAGSVDIAFSNIVSSIFAVHNKVELVSVWGTNIEDSSHIQHGIVVRAESSIHDASDLFNKIVAVNTMKNIDELMLRNWLSGSGVPRNSVQLVEVPFPRMATVLESGQVDAIAVVEPFLTYAMSKENRMLGDYYLEHNSYGEVEITSYFAKREFVFGKAYLLKRFVAGMDSALVYLRDHPDQKYQSLRKYTMLDSAIIARVGLPKFSKALPTEKGISFLVNKMKANGWIKNDVKREELVKE